MLILELEGRAEMMPFQLHVHSVNRKKSCKHSHRRNINPVGNVTLPCSSDKRSSSSKKFKLNYILLVVQLLSLYHNGSDCGLAFIQCHLPKDGLAAFIVPKTDKERLLVLSKNLLWQRRLWAREIMAVNLARGPQ